MKLSDKLKQHKNLIEEKLRGDLYKVHKGPAGGIVFMQHDDGTFVECWTQDEPREITYNEAREYCKTLNYGGYNDWSLPTKDELDKMYDNKNQIGNFKLDCYWSDTEHSQCYAWDQCFNSGTQAATDNDWIGRVRVIRRFK